MLSLLRWKNTPKRNKVNIQHTVAFVQRSTSVLSAVKTPLCSILLLICLHALWICLCVCMFFELTRTVLSVISTYSEEPVKDVWHYIASAQQHLTWVLIFICKLWLKILVWWEVSTISITISEKPDVALSECERQGHILMGFFFVSYSVDSAIFHRQKKWINNILQCRIIPHSCWVVHTITGLSVLCWIVHWLPQTLKQNLCHPNLASFLTSGFLYSGWPLGGGSLFRPCFEHD